jgi:hypothetical protein
MVEKKTVKKTIIEEVTEDKGGKKTTKKKVTKKSPTKKKSTKKKSTSKKKSTRKKSTPKTKTIIKQEVLPKKIQVNLENNVEKILVENFVSLQKVMTNLSLKFDNLTGQISKLLELFELSAKSLAEKDFELEKSNKDNKKMMEKIEGILDQNKTLARGLTLLNEKMEESIMSQDVVEPLPPIIAQVPQMPPQRPPMTMTPSQAFQEAMSAPPMRPPMRPPQVPPVKKPIIKNDSGEEYKKSISSKTQEKK